MSLKKVFNQYNKLVGKLASDVYFDIYRPDYSIANNVGTLIASNKGARFDTRAAQWAEPALSEGMYYDVFLNRSIIQPGDVLIPTGLSPTASTFSQHPIMTIESISAVKPCVALLTDHRGSIQNSSKKTIYDNVRWQWAAVGQPKGGINAKSGLADVFPFDRRKAIMYRRQGGGQYTPIVTGMSLVEVVDGAVNRWRIVDIMSSGNFTLMQVEEDSR